MEVRRLHPECISCMTKVHLEKCPQDMPEEIKVEYMQRVLNILAQAPAKYGAPVIVRSIQKLQEEMLGIKQEYAEIKRLSEACPFLMRDIIPSRTWDDMITPAPR